MYSFNDTRRKHALRRKREPITGGWRKLHDKGHYKVYYSTYIIMSYVLLHLSKEENVIKIYSRNLK
jgi:hypothetical protein